MMLRGSTRMMVALLLSVGVTACNRESTPPIEDATTQVSDPRADSELATEVQGRFYGDDLIRGGGINVEVDSGVVTLSGAAEDQQVRERAVELARTVDGVIRVQDELTLGAAEPGAIGAGTDPGASTRADSQAVSAGQDARPTTGTAEAANTRTVTGDVTPNPAWITTQIQARYFTSPDIKPWNIDVTTRSGGIVELQGEVDDLEARTEAVRIASEIEGVTRVDDQLRVRGDQQERATGAAAATGEPGVLDELSDAWVTTKVQSKFYLDDDIRGRNVDVETESAVVTLTGTVASAQERRQAVALARNTDGVTDVQDRLEVRAITGSTDPDARPQATSGRSAGDVIEDSWITTKIQSQYFLDSVVKGHDINVDTRSGVVTLKGAVETNEQKQAAEQIAGETDGVSKVSNQLTVAR